MCLTDSNRRYLITEISGKKIVVHEFVVEAFYRDDREEELVFAVREQIDKILDLRIGQTMYFLTNRDDKNSRSVVYRIE